MGMWKTDIAFLTAQKMKFFIKDFFSKCDQSRRKLRIWLHLLKKYLMESFIFCAVPLEPDYRFFIHYVKAFYKSFILRSAIQRKVVRYHVSLLQPAIQLQVLRVFLTLTNNSIKSHLLVWKYKLGPTLKSKLLHQKLPNISLNSIFCHIFYHKLDN